MPRGCKCSKSQRFESCNKHASMTFRIFAGIECDILRDGSLDFDDEILAELDFVVASVHSDFQSRRSGNDEARHSRDSESVRHDAGASDRPVTV